MNLQLLLAGFGGQGILFAGKVVAYAGLLQQKQVTWLPSYGPEMRGGTANCSVCIDDHPIGSPLVLAPTVLLAMNGPSFHKFIDQVTPGGIVCYDSSLISKEESSPEQQAHFHRDDLDYYPLPATTLAATHGLEGLANMILLGVMLRQVPITSYEEFLQGLDGCIPPQKAHLIALNHQAFDLGYHASVSAMQG